MTNTVKRVLFTNIRSLKVERIVPLQEARKLGYEVVLMAQNKMSGLEGLVSDYILVENPFDHESCLQKIVAYHKNHPGPPH